MHTRLIAVGTMLVLALLSQAARAQKPTARQQLRARTTRIQQRIRRFSPDLRWSAELALSKSANTMSSALVEHHARIVAHTASGPDAHGVATTRSVVVSEHQASSARLRFESNETVRFPAGNTTSERNAIEIRGGRKARYARTELERSYKDGDREMTQGQIDTERVLPLGLRYRSTRVYTRETGHTTRESTRRQLSFDRQR